MFECFDRKVHGPPPASIEVTMRQVGPRCFNLNSRHSRTGDSLLQALILLATYKDVKARAVGVMDKNAFRCLLDRYLELPGTMEYIGLQFV